LAAAKRITARTKTAAKFPSEPTARDRKILDRRKGRI